MASVVPQFPGEELGQLRSRRCEGEKDGVMSGYPSLESLISRICSHVLPGPTEVSEEPRACSSFSCADLSFYTLWVSVAKNQIVLGVFLVQTPRILCCPCTPCPGVHVLCFTPAVLPLPGRGAASCARTRVCRCSSGYFRSSPQVFSRAIPVSSDQQMPGGELCLMSVLWAVSSLQVASS